MHKQYIRTLATIAMFLKQEGVRTAITEAENLDEIYQILSK